LTDMWAGQWGKSE